MLLYQVHPKHNHCFKNDYFFSVCFFLSILPPLFDVGQCHILEWLLDNSELKDDVNEEDINQQTLLHLAALVGNQKCLVIKQLLQTKLGDFTIIRFVHHRV